MLIKDTIVYITISLACIVFLLWIIPAYTPPYPGYGMPSSMVPNISVGFIFILSLIGILQNWIKYKTKKIKFKKDNEESKIHLLHLIYYFVPCFVLMTAIKRFGFIITVFMFMMIMQLICGQRNSITLLLVAISTAIFFFVVMTYGLGIPMP